MGRKVWGLGGWFGLGRAGFRLARGGVGLGCDGFWGCGLGVWGGTGWVRGLAGRVSGPAKLRLGMGG